RTPGSVALPERHASRLAGGRRDHHPFGRDVVDTPGRSAEEERLPHPRLVDHLLVELADAGAVREEDAVEAAIGDGSTARDRQALCSGPAAHRAGGAVPDDPGPQ